jgi:hypothetical protein|tara:strand:+ start:185 stop:694 length:510 start_codon:yes stop_codon:yes gene_type:complete
MKFCIYIVSFAFLISCSSPEQSMDKSVSKELESTEVMKVLITSKKELDSLEMKQYIKLKIKDLIELQEVLHNPELDDEMKMYAKEMILKTYPDEKLLEKEYQIRAYNSVEFIKNVQKKSNKKIIIGDWKGNKDSWRISLELYQNDTLDVLLHPSKSDNGLKFILDVKAD